MIYMQSARRETVECVCGERQREREIPMKVPETAVRRQQRPDISVNLCMLAVPVCLWPDVGPIVR